MERLHGKTLYGDAKTDEIQRLVDELSGIIIEMDVNWEELEKEYKNKVAKRDEK
jgi:hypothetical protein